MVRFLIGGHPHARLHVRSWGDGPPVVFLHGLGASSRYWDLVAGADGGFRGIAPDLLGFGRSPKPRGAAYDIGTHVAALAPVVPPDSVIVGHSTGAVVGAALAARLTNRPRALLLIGLPAYRDPISAREQIRELGALARLTVDGRIAARLLCGLMCTVRPLAMVAARVLATDVPPAVAVDGVRHTWRSYSRTLEHVLVGHGPRDDLAAADCPILLLHGCDDGVARPSGADALAQRLSAGGARIEYRAVDGDHHLPLRRPDLVAGAVSELAGDHDH